MTTRQRGRNAIQRIHNAAIAAAAALLPKDHVKHDEILNLRQKDVPVAVCGNCTHWQPVIDEDGQCCANPPTVVPNMGVPDGEAGKTLWPKTSSGDVCGCWDAGCEPF